jgi:hypothetical protein
VSREPIASYYWLFVRMFETRKPPYNSLVRARDSRTFLAILVSCISNLILQSCYAGSCLLFGRPAAGRAGRGGSLIVPPSLVQQIVGLAVCAVDVRSKEPGVQLALMRNLLLFLGFLPQKIRYIEGIGSLFDVPGRSTFQAYSILCLPVLRFDSLSLSTRNISKSLCTKRIATSSRRAELTMA